MAQNNGFIISVHSYKQTYKSIERIWEEGGPGGFSTGSGAGKDSWPGLCSTACLASHWGEFRRLQQKLKGCQSFTIHLKREKNILTELCVLPWIETTHVERAFRNTNECQKFSNLFPAHIFFHIFFSSFVLVVL